MDCRANTIKDWPFYLTHWKFFSFHLIARLCLILYYWILFFIFKYNRNSDILPNFNTKLTFVKPPLQMLFWIIPQSFFSNKRWRGKNNEWCMSQRTFMKSGLKNLIISSMQEHFLRWLLLYFSLDTGKEPKIFGCCCNFD